MSVTTGRHAILAQVGYEMAQGLVDQVRADGMPTANSKRFKLTINIMLNAATNLAAGVPTGEPLPVGFRRAAGEDAAYAGDCGAKQVQRSESEGDVSARIGPGGRERD